MPAWTDYTSKTTPADTDELMLKDYSDSNKANKRILFSGIWNWIVNKLTNAVIANLETSPQTIVGAINSLNSNMFSKGKVYTSGSYDDFMDHGHYVCSNSVNNAPVSEGWFALTVFESTADNDIVQIAHALSSRIQAWRTYSNKEWSSWRVENLSSLTTTAKDSLVSAMNELNGKFKVIEYTSDSLNIPPRTGGYIKIDNIIPLGYIPITSTVANASLPGGAVYVLTSISKTSNENFINYFNRHTETTLTTTLTFEIICIKK